MTKADNTEPIQNINQDELLLKYADFAMKQLDALKLLKGKHPIPFLQVFYSTADILSFITQSKGLGQGERFKRFAARYIIHRLPELTVEDLWGGRCSLLHDNTPKSNQVGARQIIYAFRFSIDHIKDKLSAIENPPPHVYCDCNLLFNSLVYAMSDIANEIKDDAVARDAYLSRVAESYVIKL